MCVRACVCVCRREDVGNCYVEIGTITKARVTAGNVNKNATERERKKKHFESGRMLNKINKSQNH